MILFFQFVYKNKYKTSNLVESVSNENTHTSAQRFPQRLPQHLPQHLEITMAGQLSDYEVQRLQRIEANKKRMEQLGLVEV